jgi:hypothetical protein
MERSCQKPRKQDEKQFHLPPPPPSPGTRRGRSMPLIDSRQQSSTEKEDSDGYCRYFKLGEMSHIYRIDTSTCSCLRYQKEAKKRPRPCCKARFNATLAAVGGKSRLVSTAHLPTLSFRKRLGRLPGRGRRQSPLDQSRAPDHRVGPLPVPPSFCVPAVRVEAGAGLGSGCCAWFSLR